MAGLPTYVSTADSAFPDHYARWAVPVADRGAEMAFRSCYRHPQIRQRGLCRTRTGFPINSVYLTVHANVTATCHQKPIQLLILK